MTISSKEREIIRELAKQVKDAAQRPEMKKREELWYAHNELKTTDPVIAVFPEMSWREIITPESLQCECDEAREMEWFLRAKLFRANVIDDDVPVNDIWEVRKIITDTGWDKLNPNHKNAAFANPSFRAWATYRWHGEMILILMPEQNISSRLSKNQISCPDWVRRKLSTMKKKPWRN